MSGQTIQNPLITDLIPHRGQMLLIDEIVSVDTESAISKTKVKRSWPLSEGDSVSALIIIEVAAQTCGLCNGLHRMQEKGMDSDKTGFLVGIKTARLYVDRLPVGAELIAEVRNCFKYEGFREVEGKVKMNTRLVGEVTLQVVQPESGTNRNAL
jgi:predicted hotdog family 3-hydroxylacyl-ACP dehydratase